MSNYILTTICVITSDEVSNRAISSKQMAVRNLGMPALIYDRYANREEYSHNAENRFKSPVKDPLSTFSIDVDAASYSNIRRFINQGDKLYTSRNASERCRTHRRDDQLLQL